MLQLELMNLSNRPMNDSEKVELISFQTQIFEEHFKQTAAGQFHVGMHLIPGVRFYSMNTFISYF